MKYTLELNVREGESNVIFTTILLNSFKVNIVERYADCNAEKPKLCEVLFKVRTLDDQIFKKKDGNVNTYIRGDDFIKYKNLKKILSSYRYKKKLIDRKEAEQDLVHFILSMVISNYEF
ncbi:prevent-host-death protein [Chryseobacterium sp. KACC 21268]|nr:prevent-host-death protein [Chryseobacterium sp. KACC 21268]